MRLAEQIDVSFSRPGRARGIKRQHARAIRQWDKRNLKSEDCPSTLPFNRYRGWVS